MFRMGTRKGDEPRAENMVPRTPPPFLRVHASNALLRDRESVSLLEQGLAMGQRCEFSGFGADASLESPAEFSLSLFNEPPHLDEIADRIATARAGGAVSTLLVAIKPSQLVMLGRWLDKRATEGRLANTRLIVADDVAGVARQLPERLRPLDGPNVIRMPVNPEVDTTVFRNFYVFSPQLHALVARIRDFATNGISRAYLLGGPGSGKTSLAFHYFLSRSKGQFVAVNLMAENTNDKAAVKSLLCGHVSGAFPGAGARTGAFAHARDGVCFLDESHGVSGAVMEVLMEALDNNQYLPFGASAKRTLDCAVLFATNRSWTHLQNSVNLDEFTRLGAATLQVPELSKREEDLIAVVASTLARLGSRCTNWSAPTGLSTEAWQRMLECRWHGNVRAVIRVMESAFVDTAVRGSESLIPVGDIDQGILLWEPKTHHSHQLYAVA